jgi:hypothetical protein
VAASLGIIGTTVVVVRRRRRALSGRAASALALVFLVLVLGSYMLVASVSFTVWLKATSCLGDGCLENIRGRRYAGREGFLRSLDEPVQAQMPRVRDDGSPDGRPSD